MEKVVFVVPDGLQNWSSIAAVSEILVWANQYTETRGNANRLSILLKTKGSAVRSQETGFAFLPNKIIGEHEKASMVVIPSLSQQYREMVDDNPELIAWIIRQRLMGAEVASICTGAFLLAATGLADGNACATHWDAADDLRKMFPKVKVCTDVLTGRDGIYTNAGGYSFLNFALFLVEKYFDRATAIRCAKMFQIDIGRSSQSPFAIFSGYKQHHDLTVLRAQEYIELHFGKRIVLETLAAEVAASRRNFDRRFIKATGYTPAQYIQRVRIEYAKNALQENEKEVFEIMQESGYTDEKAFRQVFRALVGLSPLDYKARYSLPLVSQVHLSKETM